MHFEQTGWLGRQQILVTGLVDRVANGTVHYRNRIE
jgi:hypothetical protein